MGETTIAPPPPEEAPAGSFLSRALGVFISPGAAFEDIARKPDFIAPLIVATVSAIAVTETMIGKIGMERIVRKQIEMSSRASQMSADQIEQGVRQGALYGTIWHQSMEKPSCPPVPAGARASVAARHRDYG